MLEELLASLAPPSEDSLRRGARRERRKLFLRKDAEEESEKCESLDMKLVPRLRSRHRLSKSCCSCCCGEGPRRGFTGGLGGDMSDNIMPIKR